jgi:hypothetical protein
VPGPGIDPGEVGHRAEVPAADGGHDQDRDQVPDQPGAEPDVPPVHADPPLLVGGRRDVPDPHPAIVATSAISISTAPPISQVTIASGPAARVTHAALLSPVTRQVISPAQVRAKDSTASGKNGTVCSARQHHVNVDQAGILPSDRYSSSV